MTKLSNILHVDDDEDIRIIVDMALDISGDLDVMQAASGPEALRKVDGFTPDLFLLDYMMPEMNGEKTLQELRKHPGLAEVPVIFMTARVEADLVGGLLERGALAVIPKPFDPMTLIDEIQAAWSSQMADA